MVIVECASMMSVLRTHGGFALALFQGWRGGLKYCWKMCHSNFSFQNKFIIFFFMWSFSRHFKNCVYLKVCLQMMVVMKTEIFMFY